MRRVYIKKWCETANSAPTLYVFSERIPPGQILHVHTCYAHVPDRDATELIFLGVRNGGVDVFLRVRGPAAAAEGMSARRDFFVGEGDQVFAYFPSATGTDKIELHVIGCLIPLAEWRMTGE